MIQVDDGSSILSGLVVKYTAGNTILCDDSTSCKEAGDNNNYHRRRRGQTFNMSVVESLSLLHLLFIS